MVNRNKCYLSVKFVRNDKSKEKWESQNNTIPQNKEKVKFFFSKTINHQNWTATCSKKNV